MPEKIRLHLEYEQGGNEGVANLIQLKDRLATRQTALISRLTSSSRGYPGLSKEDSDWLECSYPVLSILAPVMATSEEKIEFPGDPMCLYSALSYPVSQVVETRRKGFGEDAPYNDLHPQWGILPTTEYRLSVDGNGIRQYDGLLLNTDQTIFDPRVWNEKVKEYFIKNVLSPIQPKVVLISAVSPAHRYAIDIARTVRHYLPDCIIILGGRHTDETIHYDELTKQVQLKPTSTIKVLNPDAERVFDFLLAGEGYYALDLLMKCISLAMDIETKNVSQSEVIEVISNFAPVLGPLPGHALIAALEADTLHIWPVSGEKIKLGDLPSPYSAFAIRARFSIFETNKHVSRTAQFMVTNACPFHCYFCSEGVTVVGEFLSFKAPEIEAALARVIEYIDYGAEALFFDDSIFWGGNIGHIVNFCKEWIRIRELARQASTPTIQIFGREIETSKITGLVWGAQFTVDFLASRRVPEEAIFVLRTMQAAGCSYIYMGIESMSEAVITHVHKNINREQPWDQRVRIALGLARSAGIRVGSSVLFGLDGETETTIAETIEKVEELVAEDLLYVASPNILTYHPNTEITHLHQMEEKLDYHSTNLDNRPPYVYFEEAFPSVVSKNLTEEHIWTIHHQTQERWGKKRNSNPMPEVVLREEWVSDASLPNS
jgi:radical SAM superfamily enzyme YgiQ (UPF0313 family)